MLIFSIVILGSLRAVAETSEFAYYLNRSARCIRQAKFERFNNNRLYGIVMSRTLQFLLREINLDAHLFFALRRPPQSVLLYLSHSYFPLLSSVIDDVLTEQ